MKIPLDIAKNEPHKGLIFKIIPIKLHPRGFGSVKFFVDTGSPISFLSGDDAIRLNFPMHILDFTKRGVLMGQSIMLAEIKNVILSFINEKGEHIEIKPPIFYISKGLRRGKEAIPYYPSVLGTDFLDSCKLALYYNPSKNITYFERED